MTINAFLKNLKANKHNTFWYIFKNLSHKKRNNYGYIWIFIHKYFAESLKIFTATGFVRSLLQLPLQTYLHIYFRCNWCSRV